MFLDRLLVLLLSLGFAAGSALAAGDPASRFFARAATQAQFSIGFALQPEALDGVRALHSLTVDDGESLYRALQAEPGLVERLRVYAQQPLPQQKALLRKVFAIECASLGIVAPELVLDEDFARGAFFDFDLEHPGPGRVIINPRPAGPAEEALFPLALLMHETRHSAQFQAAFGLAPSSPLQVAAREFATAFRAQKALAGDLSFLDFMTLNHEYEAFRFGNFVLGRLTEFAVDPISLGSFASQFTRGEQTKIDLVELAREPDPRSMLERFNALEREQYELLHPQAPSGK